MPVGECVPKLSGGNPVKPVKRSLFFRKSTTGMPVGIYVGLLHECVMLIIKYERRVGGAKVWA